MPSLDISSCYSIPYYRTATKFRRCTHLSKKQLTMLKKVTKLIVKFILKNMSASQIEGVMKRLKKNNPDMHKAVLDVQELKKRARKTEESAQKIKEIAKKYRD